MPAQRRLPRPTQVGLDGVLCSLSLPCAPAAQDMLFGPSHAWTERRRAIIVHSRAQLRMQGRGV